MTNVQNVNKQISTNQSGFFRFDEVKAGQTYIVRIRAKRYNFKPQVVTVMENLSELNFSTDDF